MLAVFRRSLPFLKPILLLVVLTFVLFFGVNWWSDRNQAVGNNDIAALVNGVPISTREAQNLAQRLESQYRQMFGEQYAQLRQSLDLRRMAQQQLIQRQLVLQDARRLGLAVSDDELTATIANMPQFQENGGFIGTTKYAQLLRAQGISPDQYETSVADDLVAQKWQQLIGASIVVPRSEVEAEFTRRHEKVNLEYVALPLDRYESSTAEATDSDLAAWFNAHRDRYKEGEGRRALYALFDDKAAEGRIKIDDAEIKAYYDGNQTQFQRPEQRRARHVLITVPENAPAEAVEAAKRKAEDVAARARSGEEFGKLAMQFSDDPGSKSRGGDLGFFGRGQMVPAFEEAAFSLPSGQISDPVRTNFGFHVIKAEEARPAGLQPLEEVKKQIEGQLRFARLKDVSGQMANEFLGKLKGGADFKTAAQQMGLELQDTGVVTRSSTVPGLGAVPAMIDAIFALEKGKTSEAIVLPRGQAVVMLQDLLTDYTPTFEARRDRVLADYKRERAREVAKADLARASAGGDLAAAAKALKLEVRRTTPAFSRGGDLQDVGYDKKVEEAVFAAATGQIAGPIDGTKAIVIARVLGRESADKSKLAEEEASIRETLRGPRAQSLVQQRLEALRKAATVEDGPAFVKTEKDQDQRS